MKQKKFIIAMSLCLALIAAVVVGFNIDGKVALANDPNDFVIENDVLTKYNGSDTTVTVPDGVVAIGTNAFSNNRTVIEVVLPSSCITIQDYSFNYCSLLTSINLDYVETIGNGAFESAAFATLHIGASVKSIGTGAFAYNSSLVSVTMDDGLESIGASAFSSTRNLTSIQIASTVTSFGSRCFNNSGITAIVIPEGVSALPASMFNGCGSLSSVSLPSTLTVIGSQAFNGCSALTELTLNEGLLEIGAYCFQGCAIKNVHIPASVENLHDRDTYEDGNGQIHPLYSFTFFGNTSVESFTVDPENQYYSAQNNIIYNKDYSNALMLAPASTVTNASLNSNVKAIMEGAFSNNTTIESVVINEGCTTIDHNVFAFSSNLSSVTIPSTITNIGSGAFAYTSITSIVLPEGLLELGSSEGFTGVFAGCSQLETVNLPSTLTYIGARTFQNCTSLKEVTIPAFLTAYPDGFLDGCTSLEAINVAQGNTAFTSDNGILYRGTALILVPAGHKMKVYNIPNTTTEIANMAFAQNKNLVYVFIPSSVTAMGTGVFNGCSQLATVEMEANLTSIPQNTFANSGLRSFEIPDSVTTIEGNAFSNCINLTKLDLKNVTTLQWGCFNACGLIELILPDTLTSCASGIAQSCPNLTTVRLSAAFTSIPTAMFYGCNSLSEIIIPEGIQTINGYTFASLPALRELNIPKSITSINASAFNNLSGMVAYNVDPENENYTSVDGILYSKDMTSLMFYPMAATTEILVLPQGVTSIPRYAFQNNASLKEVVLPESLKAIPDYAFDNCTSLEKINFLEGLETIGFRTFYNTALTSVTIPSTVTMIDMAAFSECKKLEEVIYLGAPVYSASLFAGCTALTYFEISEGITIIPQYMFNNCTNLKEIVIASTVATIEANAFENCTAVEKLVLSGDLSYLQPYTFAGMTSLKDVVILTAQAPTLGTYTWSPVGNYFENIAENPTLYILEGAQGFYGTEEEPTYWEEAFNIVEITPAGFISVNLVGTADDDHNVTLNWNHLPWADRYDIYIGQDLVGTTKNNTFIYNASIGGQTLSFNVVAVNDNVNGDFSYTVDVNVHKNELEQLNDLLDAAQEQINSLRVQNTQSDAEIAQLQNDLEAIRALLSNAETSNEQYLTLIAELEARLAQSGTSEGCQGSTQSIFGILAIIVLLFAAAVIILRKEGKKQK